MRGLYDSKPFYIEKEPLPQATHINIPVSISFHK